MSLPFTTTTVKIERQLSPLQDSLEALVFATVVTSVPCVVQGLSGSETDNGGSQVIRSGTADFNPGIDVRSYDRITDESTGDVYEAGAVVRRTGFGLDHVKVQLTLVQGANLIG